MRTLNRMTAVSIVVLSVVFCLAQFNPKKSAAFYNKCPQQSAAASISDAEDFSLINLLTLKFM